MIDFSGHVIDPTPAPWKPSAGQWCKLRINDLGKQGALAQQGAWTAKDGSLVAIHVAAFHESPSVTTRADGSIEKTGGERHPSRLVLVDKDGNDFTIPIKLANGHGEWVAVFFYPDSPSIVSLEPLLEMGDMPPGRPIHPDWKPQG